MKEFISLSVPLVLLFVALLAITLGSAHRANKEWKASPEPYMLYCEKDGWGSQRVRVLTNKCTQENGITTYDKGTTTRACEGRIRR